MQFTHLASRIYRRSLTSRCGVFLARAETGVLDPGSDHTNATDVLQAHGVDVERIHRLYPHTLRYPPGRILATIAALKDIDVHDVRTLNRDPLLWKSDPRCWAPRLAMLRDMGFDAPKLVAVCPGVLRRPPETLRTKVETLSRLGLDAAKVVRFCPTVFNYSEDRIRGTLAFFNEVSMDGVRVVNSSPAVLCCSVDTKLRPIFRFVTVEMGRDITELQRNPVCFTFSLDGRLRPRHLFATLHSKRHRNIGTFFRYSDPRFAKFIGRPVGEYHTWLSL